MENADERTANRTAATKRIIRELTRQQAAIVSVVILMFLSSGLTLIQPLLFKMLFDVAIPQKDGGLVGWLILGMIVMPLIAVATTSLQEYRRVRIGETVSLAGRSFVSVNARSSQNRRGVHRTRAASGRIKCDYAIRHAGRDVHAEP